jgi:hypothetical protein
MKLTAFNHKPYFGSSDAHSFLNFRIKLNFVLVLCIPSYHNLDKTTSVQTIEYLVVHSPTAQSIDRSAQQASLIKRFADPETALDLQSVS